ncbi:MAG TPA: RNA methyltransferase [Cytophagaceae bacterium]|nr:RNA methyltransferase [Cytophagaceae bacterium]
MFSKNKAKFIKSLQIKKFRTEYKQFLTEGAKSVLELANSDFVIHDLLVTERFYGEHELLLKKLSVKAEIISEKELSSISSFTTNNAGLAVASMKENKPLSIQQNEYALILDDIKDPGNLGTIVRIADWYGIGNIICSETTADFYNPKVIASSMGSFTRIKVYYCPLPDFLSKNTMPVYAADLEGKDVHHFSFAKGGYILMGNESEGISKEITKYITDKIHIPRYGQAESLNVAIASAIIIDNLKRS